jgi:hypothetical protein
MIGVGDLPRRPEAGEAIGLHAAEEVDVMELLHLSP